MLSRNGAIWIEDRKLSWDNRARRRSCSQLGPTETAPAGSSEDIPRYDDHTVKDSIWKRRVSSLPWAICSPPLGRFRWYFHCPAGPMWFRMCMFVLSTWVFTGPQTSPNAIKTQTGSKGRGQDMCTPWVCMSLTANQPLEDILTGTHIIKCTYYYVHIYLLLGLWVYLKSTFQKWIHLIPAHVLPLFYYYSVATHRRLWLPLRRRLP